MSNVHADHVLTVMLSQNVCLVNECAVLDKSNVVTLNVCDHLSFCDWERYLLGICYSR